VGAGPIVPQLSASFDAFWNSKYAYPLASLAGPAPAASPEQPQIPVPAAPEVSQAQGVAEEDADWLRRELDARLLKLIWAPATVIADRPAKIASDVSPDQEENIANNIAVLLRSAQQEILVVSPYFVPGKEGVALMRELTARGVHIRIVTNSLASTDAPCTTATRVIAWRC
jgi:putative cardiolipin synthase